MPSRGKNKEMRYLRSNRPTRGVLKGLLLAKNFENRRIPSRPISCTTIPFFRYFNSKSSAMKAYSVLARKSRSEDCQTLIAQQKQKEHTQHSCQIHWERMMLQGLNQSSRSAPSALRRSRQSVPISIKFDKIKYLGSYISQDVKNRDDRQCCCSSSLMGSDWVFSFG